MTVLGKSSGGLFAKMLVQSSGRDLWDSVFARPFEEIRATPERRDELAAYFGYFNAAVGVLALGLQLFGTGRILNRAGVVGALSILPSALGLGSLGVALVPGLWAASFVKGSDALFRYSVNDATSQILYLPVAPNGRASAKAFIDSVVKPLSIGAAGLAQMAIWGGTVFLISSQRTHLAGIFGMTADAAQSFPIPSMAPGLLLVFLLYFALGFMLYGALYAAIGAMCNTIQETQQYAIFVTMFIIVGFFAVFALIKDPTGPLGVTMSYIPFFAPFTMPVRWSLASVPPMELVLSLTLMVLALLACVWLAARIYRTGILMYGKKPSWGELWRWIRA